MWLLWVNQLRLGREVGGLQPAGPVWVMAELRFYPKSHGEPLLL